MAHKTILFLEFWQFNRIVINLKLWNLIKFVVQVLRIYIELCIYNIQGTIRLLSYITCTSVWSSTFMDFLGSFFGTLVISKALSRVWHKALLFKIPSFGFPPSICALLSTIFLTDASQLWYMSCFSASIYQLFSRVVFSLQIIPLFYQWYPFWCIKPDLFICR